MSSSLMLPFESETSHFILLKCTVWILPAASSMVWNMKFIKYKENKSIVTNKKIAYLQRSFIYVFRYIKVIEIHLYYPVIIKNILLSFNKSQCTVCPHSVSKVWLFNHNIIQRRLHRCRTASWTAGNQTKNRLSTFNIWDVIKCNLVNHHLPSFNLPRAPDRNPNCGWPSCLIICWICPMLML